MKSTNYSKQAFKNYWGRSTGLKEAREKVGYLKTL